MVSQSFTVNLQLSGEVRRLVLSKGGQETYLHVIIKILSYIYFWDDDLVIEPRFRFHGYKPDLLRLDDNPNPKVIDKDIGMWVECKQVKLSKLDDLVRYSRAQVYWFHTTKHLDRAMKPRDLKKFKRLQMVKVIGISSEYENTNISGISILRKSLQVHPVKWILQWTTEQNLHIFLPDILDPVTIYFEKSSFES